MITPEAAKRRSTAALVGLLVLPPLAPLAWIWYSQADRPRYWKSSLVRAGLALLVLSLVPAVATVGLAATGQESAFPFDPVASGTALLVGWTLSTVLLTAGVTLTERALRRDGSRDS